MSVATLTPEQAATLRESTEVLLDRRGVRTRMMVLHLCADIVAIACDGVGEHPGRTARAAAELILPDKVLRLDPSTVAELAVACERAARLPRT